MKQFSIKTEKLATKCEICHSNDKFDAENNTCQRCSSILIEPSTLNQEIKKSNLQINSLMRLPEVIVSGICSVALSIFLSIILAKLVNELLKGTIILLIGFIPLWIMYFQVNFRLVLKGLLDVCLSSLIGGLMMGILFYYFGRMTLISVEAGMLFGCATGSITKTLIFMLTLCEKRNS